MPSQTEKAEKCLQYFSVILQQQTSWLFFSGLLVSNKQMQ